VSFPEWFSQNQSEGVPAAQEAYPEPVGILVPVSFGLMVNMLMYVLYIYVYILYIYIYILSMHICTYTYLYLYSYIYIMNMCYL